LPFTKLNGPYIQSTVINRDLYVVYMIPKSGHHRIWSYYMSNQRFVKPTALRVAFFIERIRKAMEANTHITSKLDKHTWTYTGLSLEPDSSVSIVTKLRTRRPSLYSWQKLTFPSSPPLSKRPWCPESLLSGCYGDVFPRSTAVRTWNWPSTSSAEVMNAWSNISTSPYVFSAWNLFVNRADFNLIQ
jgi:hypothetical protein